MSRHRSLPLAAAAALLFVLIGCGSSGGSDGDDTTTTRPTATTDEVGDAIEGSLDDAEGDEAFDEFIDTYRAGFEAVFPADKVTCVEEAFEEASLGDSSDEQVLAAYDACGVTAPQVAGAMMVPQLREAGVAEDKAICVAKEVGKLSQAELDGMDDAAGAALYSTCGVDAASLGG